MTPQNHKRFPVATPILAHMGVRRDDSGNVAGRRFRNRLNRLFSLLVNLLATNGR
jgi:hypothetical protein